MISLLKQMKKVDERRRKKERNEGLRKEGNGERGKAGQGPANLRH